MSYLKYSLCLVSCLCFSAFVQGADIQKPNPIDRIWQSRVLTEDLYLQLSRRASSPVTKALLDLIFTQPVLDASLIGNSAWPAYAGQVIDLVEIEPLGVFEPIAADSPRKKTWKKIGNWLFPPTKRWVIRRQLTFKVGDRLETEQFKNSLERIKALSYIKQAKLDITPQTTTGVGVVVRTEDEFPIQVGVVLRKKRLEIRHINLAGLGHTWINAFSYDQRLGYEFTYRIPNLLGSLLTGELTYLNTQPRQLKRLRFYQLFSQLTDRAGGAEVSHQQKLKPRFLDEKDTTTTIPYNFHVQDLWLGKSWPVPVSNDRGSFYGTARIFHQAFQERPMVNEKLNRLFHDQIFLLGSWGFGYQHTATAYNVYDVGRPESMPEGVKYNLIGGYQIGEFVNRPYAGLDIARAKLMSDWGYIANSLRLGGFLGKQTIEQGTLKLATSYITPVLRSKQHAMRQFITLNYLAGFNRFTGERLSTHSKSVPKEWADLFPPGDKRLKVHLESLWWPLRLVAGCQVAVVGFIGAVALYEGNQLSQQSTLCEVLGVGLRVRHKRFVFGTLQFNLRYRPALQAIDFDISQPINLTNEDLMVGEPGTIAYKYY